MKKVLFVGMIFGAMALTSCKKDYTCTYTTIDMSGNKVEATQDFNDVKKSDKDDAEAVCDKLGGDLKTK